MSEIAIHPHVCLRCKKEVKENEKEDVNSIRNSGYCCECIDLDFLSNPRIYKSK